MKLTEIVLDVATERVADIMLDRPIPLPTERRVEGSEVGYQHRDELVSDVTV